MSQVSRIFYRLTRRRGVRSFVTKTTFESEKYIESNENNGVRTITLSHAASRNSLSLEMMKILLWNLKRDEDNESLRSIVINAVPGKVFSAGHNLKELTSTTGYKHHQEVFDTAASLMKVISDSPVPIIAAVDGLAAAAGCQLVSACDIAICTERSSFSTPGANFGIFCSTPGIPLVRNVPRKVASHMLFTGLPLSAHEAYDAGLVSKIVSENDLRNEVNRTTDAINSKSRAVVQLGKKFLQEQVELDLSTAYTFGTEMMLRNLELKDAQEGIQSFIGVCMKIVVLGELTAPSIKLEEFVINKKKSIKLTKRQLYESLFYNCTNCKRMAAVPQGAFVARKIRQMKERQFLMINVHQTEEGEKENRHAGGGDNAYNKNKTEGLELTPVKYNSKLMNSIWGLYNRYSPHNFKKNTDANEGLLPPVWDGVLFNGITTLLQIRRQSKS